MKRLLPALWCLGAMSVAQARTLESDVVLEADTDWSDEELVIPAEVQLDLNGHSLTVSAMSGSGTVVDGRKYVRLDNVAASGAQYVNTEYVPGVDTSLDFDFTTDAYKNGSLLIGCTWFTYAWLFGEAENQFYFFGGGQALAPFQANSHLRLSVETTGEVKIVDPTDESVVARKTGVNLSNRNDANELCVFGSPAGNRSTCKVHRLTVKDKGSLALDLIPAREVKSGKIGLLDLVSGRLFCSLTNTGLIAGDDVGTETSVGCIVLKGAGYPFAGFSGAIEDCVRFSLGEDADWSATETSVIHGKELELDGHSLTVDKIAGSATIKDSWQIVRLTHVESTAAQLMSTGYVPNENTTASFDFVSDYDSNRAMIYFGSAWEYNSWTFGHTPDSGGFFYFFGGGANFGAFVSRRHLRLNVDRGGNMSLSDLEEGKLLRRAKSGVTNPNNYEMTVFGAGSRRASIKVFSFKLSENGTAVRDYIPARGIGKTGNGVGLYDRVNRTLQCSTTATPLVAGEDVGEPVSVGRLVLKASAYALEEYEGELDKSLVVALAADADWTAAGNVTLPTSVLDLQGHVLKVGGLEGAGEITDSVKHEVLSGATSDKQQQVRTRYVPTVATTAELNFTPISYTNGGVFFGTEWAQYAWLFCMTTDAYYFFGAGDNMMPYQGGSRLRFTVDDHNVARIEDANTRSVLKEKTVDRRNLKEEVFVFADKSTTVNRKAEFTLHSLRFSENGELKRDYVPVRDCEAHRVGLWDRVTRTMNYSETAYDLLGELAVRTESRGAVCVVPIENSSFENFTGSIDARVSVGGTPECRLKGNLDLSMLRGVTIDTKLELGGYELKLSNLDGAGVVCDDNVREYDMFDYVAANGKQYVPTGYVPGLDTTVDFDFMSGSVYENGSAYFGCAWSAKAWLFCAASSSFYFFGNTIQLAPFATDLRMRFTVGKDNRARLEGSEGTIADKSITREGNGKELSLFGLSASSNNSKCRFYSMKVTEGDAVRLDLVPARKRSSGEIGLLNLKSGDFLANKTDTPFDVGSITNDVSSRLTVIADSAVTNSELAIRGNLQLVKKGRGTLTLAKDGQEYTGGTVVAEGCVEMASSQNDTAACSAARKFMGATGSEIIVEKGAVFDYKGNDGLSSHVLVLKGGTIRNGGADASLQASGLGETRLDDNSSIALDANGVFKDGVAHNVDLNGNRLTIATGESAFQVLSPMMMTTGIVEVAGNGCLDVRSTVTARNTDLIVGCSLALAGTMEVRNYIHNSVAANSGNGTLKVFGTFKPVTDSFYGCELQDGSTLDLSEKEGAWLMESLSAGGNGKLSFVKGSTVFVDLGSRKATGKVLSWTQAPQGVAFEIKGDGNFSFREDGIYAADGLEILFR